MSRAPSPADQPPPVETVAKPSADPEQERQRSHRSIGVLLARNLLSQLLGIARQFVILPLITPGQLGLFRYVSSLASYSKLFHIGYLSTMQARYAERHAAGDDAYCKALELLSWRQVLLGSLLFFPMMALALRGSGLSYSLLLGVAALSTLPLTGDFLTTSYHVRGEFEGIVRIELVVSLVGFVLLLTGTYLFRLPGLLLATQLPFLVTIALARRYLRPRAEGIDLKPYRRAALSFGLRMWLFSSVGLITTTFDILALAHFLGKQSPSLGFYGLGISLAQFVGVNLKAVTQVQHRLLQLTIGRAGSVTHPSVRAAVEEFFAVECLSSVWLAGLITVGSTLLLPLLFPRYGAALPVVSALLASIAISKPQRYTSMVLVLANRPATLLWSSLVGLVAMTVQFALIHAFAHDDLRLYALARLIAFTLSTGVEIALCYAVMDQSARTLRVLGRLLLANAPLLALTAAPFLPRYRLVLAVAGVALLPLSWLTYRWSFPDAPSKTWALVRGALASWLPRWRRKGS